MLFLTLLLLPSHLTRSEAKSDDILRAELLDQICSGMAEEP